MKVYKGKSVFGGIAIGKIQVYGKGEKQVKCTKVKDTEAEILRCRQATQEAIAPRNVVFHNIHNSLAEKLPKKLWILLFYTVDIF